MPQAAPLRRGSLALDQWRGLALVLVLISHGFHETGRVDGVGRVGVNLFFFISGILVFRSLAGSSGGGWRQQAASFWHRRFRRLYPALLGYVLVAVLASWGLPKLGTSRFGFGLANFPRTVPASVFYYTNYLPGPAMILGHLWSLACEMQFYLLAPLIWLAGGNGTNRRNLVFGGLTLALVGLGAAEPFMLKHPFSGAKYHFEFAVWPMMLGFFCEEKKAWVNRVPARLASLLGWITLTIGSLGLLPMLFGYPSKVLVVTSGALLLLPCFLAYAGARPMEFLPGRILSWLGMRTYSIYLWQQPFTICFFLPAVWWPVGALAAVGVGAAWFHWLEAPFLSRSRPIPGGHK